MTWKNNRAPLLYYVKLLASFQSHRWIQTGVTVRKRSIRVKIGDFVPPSDLEIWQMTLKNNWAPLPYYVRLCASIQSHWWIQTGVTVRKRSIQVKICAVLFRVTLEFDGWSRKNNRVPLLCYFKLYTYFFKANCEFKLELQYWNAHFGSKSASFFPVWPWNLRDDLEKQ